MKFDYKALADADIPLLDLKPVRQQAIESFWAKDIAKRNEFLIEAIELAIGRAPGTLPRLNPYDYIKRLTRSQQSDGELIRLDGNPILFLGLTVVGWEDLKVTGKFPYTILVGK